MSMALIQFRAEKLLNQLLIKEWTLQGHHLSGIFDASLTSKQTRNRTQYVMTGYAVSYAMIVNEGVEPEKISKKMVPGLIVYFKQRGLNDFDAVRAARATVNKWKTEGMSTQASKRFSQTGARHHFIEAVFVGYKFQIDEHFLNAIDFDISEQYRKTKSETV